MICQRCLKKVITKIDDPDLFNGREWPYYCEECDLFMFDSDVAYCAVIDKNGNVSFSTGESKGLDMSYIVGLVEDMKQCLKMMHISQLRGNSIFEMTERTDDKKKKYRLSRLGVKCQSHVLSWSISYDEKKEYLDQVIDDYCYETGV